MKTCRKCLVQYSYKDFHKNSQTKDGYAAYCKACKSQIDKDWIIQKPEEIEKRKVRSRQWKKDNPEQYKLSILKWKSENIERKWNLDKKSHLWTHYRMTIGEFIKMHEDQDGKCKMCNSFKKLVVDHDHSCCPGKITCCKCVRGLLCSRCNTLLGIANDDKKLLTQATDYLDNSKDR
jgi:hypothetical protein